MKQNSDLDARNELIEHNLRLVSHIIKKYYSNYDEQEDLISIGTIGLIKGISTFDGSKGARLATYAARCVENEILMYFRSQKKSSQDVSLSDMIETGDDGAALSLMDVVSQEDDLLETISNREDLRALRQAMQHCLTEQELQVIRLRYGLYNGRPLTLEEVGQRFNITRERIRQIEAKALRKLRYPLRSKQLRDYLES